jgi:isoleucyl-tRNA synthetase
VPEVLDCWFESGSMPFAQVHYPFENREWFEGHYPGDFIVEYIGQTRGWFYTLHVLATALFDRPSFSTCVSHGIVLGDDGQKMSKSLQNYPDPMMVFDQYGSDAMRWYLLSSSILRGTDLIVTEEGIRDTVRHVLLPVWNSWYFLSLYANAAQVSGVYRTDSDDLLDRYILAKLGQLVQATTARLDDYDLFDACAQLRRFLDALTNWYVRRSRERFWNGDQAAINTLHSVLVTLCKLLAPLLPLTSEAIYRGLTGEPSVHLSDWPSADTLPLDPDAVAAMDFAREVCSAASAVRKASGHRVRQPLPSLTVAASDSHLLAPLADIVRDELNVKVLDLSTDHATAGAFQLQLVPAVLGPRLGGQVQQVIGAVKRGDWQRTADGGVEAGGVALLDGEYVLRLVAADPDRSAALPGGRGLVVLDTALTPELEAEGVARDLVRLVQQARRDAGLNVSDRIALQLGVPESVRRQVVPFVDAIAGPTLALSLEWVHETPNAELDGEPVFVGVSKVHHSG